jgi:hypothetical protein
MKPTHRAYHRKLANWFALLAIATLLLSGSALPPARLHLTRRKPPP